MTYTMHYVLAAALVASGFAQARAQAPTTACPAQPRFTIRPTKLADSVEDAQTNLRWQRGTDQQAKMTYEDAVKYCNDLDLDGRGWRIPSTQELQTLIDKRFAPMIDDAVFRGVPSEADDLAGFWTLAEGAGMAPEVYFSKGIVGWTGRFLPQGVRCVRGASARAPLSGGDKAAAPPEKARDVKDTSKEFKAARAAAVAFCKADSKKCDQSLSFLTDPINKTYCDGGMTITGDSAKLSIQCPAGGTAVKLTGRGSTWHVDSVDYVPGGE